MWKELSAPLSNGRWHIALTTTRTARLAVIAVCAVLLTVMGAVGFMGCATTGNMTQTQESALWKTLARDAALAAMAFSPEAAVAMSTVCACVNAADTTGASKEALQQLWTELNDLQATAIVHMLNDVIVLSGVDVSGDAEKYFEILKAMCEVVTLK